MFATTQASPKPLESAVPEHALCPGGVYLDTTIAPSNLLARLHWLAAAVCIGALSAVYAPVIVGQPLWLLFWALSVALLLGSTLYARRKAAHIWHLRLDTHGWQLAPEGGDFQPVALVGQVRLWRWLTTLRLRSRAGETVSLAIAPDAMAEEDYRRLRVWLVTQAGR